MVQTTRSMTERSWRIALEVAIVGLGIYLYFFVRGIVDAKVDVALAHSHRIIDLEQRLHLFHEPALQARIMDHAWLVTVMNGIYIYGHWPVVIGTLIWLVWRHPAEYPRFRNAMMLSGLVGLMIFVTYPVAPPRLVPDFGFWDSVTARSHAYRVLQPPSLTNPYAALPSLHFGWNLLMGIAWFRLSGSLPGRIFGLVMPPLMFTAIILTANHFILDGIAGGTLALIGLLVASLLHRGWAGRTQPRTQRPSSGRFRSGLRATARPIGIIPDQRPPQETHGTTAPPPA